MTSDYRPHSAPKLDRDCGCSIHHHWVLFRIEVLSKSFRSVSCVSSLLVVLICADSILQVGFGADPDSAVCYLNHLDTFDPYASNGESRLTGHRPCIALKTKEDGPYFLLLTLDIYDRITEESELCVASSIERLDVPLRSLISDNSSTLQKAYCDYVVIKIETEAASPEFVGMLSRATHLVQPSEIKLKNGDIVESVGLTQFIQFPQEQLPIVRKFRVARDSHEFEYSPKSGRFYSYSIVTPGTKETFEGVAAIRVDSEGNRAFYGVIRRAGFEHFSKVFKNHEVFALVSELSDRD